MPFPAKLPSLPIDATRQTDGSYKIGMKVRWYNLWEQIMSTVGLAVTVKPFTDLQDISADYFVAGIKGFFGVAAIPKDFGVCKVRAL